MSKRNQRAFSLIEVTVALGIVTFAVVSVMGLLPMGLNVMREAADQTAVAQITREISADLLLTPFSELDAYIGAHGTRHFDADGVRTDDSSAYFRADASLAPSEFPGSASSANLNSNVRCVRIQIVSRAHSGASSTTNQRVLQIANSGN